ncbi:MAG: hypothetical protein FD153_530 [Rhodospirillaceae bacterium]|nr:MAG: hypothetical protein FD153_530 [Rhodospirillaceae bacterium]
MEHALGGHATDGNRSKRQDGGSTESPKKQTVRIFWRVAGVRNGYVPPRPEDRKLLQNLLSVNADSIKRVLTELTHLYRQEFKPAKQYRTGSGRLIA